jgi:hypothetical protein
MKLQGSVLVFHTEQLRSVFHGHADRLEGRQPAWTISASSMCSANICTRIGVAPESVPSGTRTPASKIVFGFHIAMVLRECVL